MGGDASSIPAEQQNGACVCVSAVYSLVISATELGCSLLARSHSYPLSLAGNGQCSRKGRFRAKMRLQTLLHVEVLARNSKCQASRKPLQLSSGWEQYMQASLGGMAALVCYSRGAKLALRWDPLMIPDGAPVHRHQYGSFWPSWRFH